MATKKKLQKEIKRLRKKAQKALKIQQKTEKKLKGLKAVIGARKHAAPEKKIKTKKHVPAGNASDQTVREDELEYITVVKTQREAWKRHSFLRDRYEAYLSAGECKSDSRAMANRDLEKQFGKTFGYTDNELQEILT